MKTHDYTKRYWGHDYAITNIQDKGLFIKAMGWGYGLTVGDNIIFENKEAPSGGAQYKIEKIEYFSDPRDMWSGTFSYNPRTKPEA